MQLRKLLIPGYTGENQVPTRITGGIDFEVESLAHDSRSVERGAVFFALPGRKTTGSHFVEEALDRGARAVVGTPDVQVPEGVTVVRSELVRRLMAAMACRFYGHPSGELTLIGVTGTSGKTTTTYLFEAIAKFLGWSVGVIGTVSYRFAGRVYDAPFTTPEAVELQALLRSMVQAGVTHVVMEVSSHALAQDRVWGCLWDGAVFTNLGRDHLDYHESIEEYFAAKVRLFQEGLSLSTKKRRFAAVNIDDFWGLSLLKKRLNVPTITYSLLTDADITAYATRYASTGISTKIRAGKEKIEVSSHLIGEPHLYNMVAATAAAKGLGVTLHEITEGIARCDRIPGRLEEIDVGRSFRVFVDYAHKPDAMEKTLMSFREVAEKRLITVFGCGGDRDRGKRPLMGMIAGRLSDLVVLTSDNPRGEDPKDIITEIEKGVVRSGMTLGPSSNPKIAESEERVYFVVPDRLSAIRRALDVAQPGDVVVIAGKGHEDYQIVGTKRLHFDDAEEVRNYMNAPE